MKEWLEPRTHASTCITATSASWIDQVETWFSILCRQAIERGVVRSVRALMNAIQRFLDSWDDHKHPFVWVKTADDLLCRQNMNPISVSGQ